MKGAIHYFYEWIKREKISVWMDAGPIERRPSSGADPNRAEWGPRPSLKLGKIPFKKDYVGKYSEF
jgi:hypothetical protein